MNLISRAAPAFIAILVYGVALWRMAPLPDGDEPHYLVIAHSLAFDADIDMGNQYDDGAIRLYYPQQRDGVEIRNLVRGKVDGRQLPTHPVGMPLLLAPFIRLGAGHVESRVVLALIGALMADQMMRLLRDHASLTRPWRWLVWAAICLCLPIVTYATRIFPEIIGACLVTIGLRGLLVRSPDARSRILVASCAALLIWAHPRFLPLAIGLVAGMIARLVIEVRPVTASVVRQYWVLALPLGAVVGYLAFIRVIYGADRIDIANTPIETRDGLGRFFDLTWFYYSGVRSLIDARIGWLPYAPVHLLGILGTFAMAARYPTAVAVGAGSFLLYIWLISIPPFYPAASPQGRFMVVLVPLIALPLAYLTATRSWARYTCLALVAYSLMIVAAAVISPEDLWPGESDTATLGPIEPVRWLWPSRPSGASGFLASGPGLTSEIGTRQPDGLLMARAGDPPGIIATSSERLIRQGGYTARFMLRASGPPGREVARAELVGDGDVLAARPIAAREAGNQDREFRIELSTTLDAATQVLARVVFTGGGEVAIREIELLPVPRPTRLDPNRDWYKAAAWLAGLLLAGGVLFYSERRRYTPASA